jgi:hypothetical protein
MLRGESMIRSHLIGSRYAREELGCEVTLAWAPDAFSGHAHTLPTILNGCGIERLLHGRGVPEDTPCSWWEGPVDGVGDRVGRRDRDVPLSPRDPGVRHL